MVDGTSLSRVLAVTAAFLSLAAEAAVYRCERGGAPVYTDTPCAAGAEALEPRQPNSIAADAQADLAADYDSRRERERELSSAADAQWLQLHEHRKAEAERVRQGLVEGRVVPGMSRADVRHVRGAPDSIEPGAGADGERWVYRRGKKREVVAFEAGRVKGAAAPSKAAAAAPKPQPKSAPKPSAKKSKDRK